MLKLIINISKQSIVLLDSMAQKSRQGNKQNGTAAYKSEHLDNGKKSIVTRVEIYNYTLSDESLFLKDFFSCPFQFHLSRFYYIKKEDKRNQ